MTSKPAPVVSDTWDASRYPTVARQLRSEASGYRSIALQTFSQQDLFATFAEPVRNLLQKHYEEIAVAMEEMADTAQGFADQARERLGLTEAV